MNSCYIFEWIDTFINAWKGKDFHAINEIFSAIEEYWENPFYKISSEKKSLQEAWEEIVYQEDIILTIDILSEEGNSFILEWYLKYRDLRDDSVYEMDGIYHLRFNSEKKCVYFKQWWVLNGC